VRQAHWTNLSFILLRSLLFFLDCQPLTEEEGCCFCVCLMMAGLLEKLWDDVLAGPQPDKGLKKLRKKAMPSPDSALPGDNGLFPYYFYGACWFFECFGASFSGKKAFKILESG
jgi:hypothetical protein